LKLSAKVNLKEREGRFQVGKSGIYPGRVDFTARRNSVTAYARRLLDLSGPASA
jgi:hypothetical protein